MWLQKYHFYMDISIIINLHVNRRSVGTRQSVTYYL